ncbi:MAG: hypothetical protein ACRDOL_16095 [Streptosporangiaceae bacterium]
MPAHSVLAGTHEPGSRSEETAQRLVVAWQHPQDRSIQPVGFLIRDGKGYEFHYIRNALNVTDFRPLLGFEDLHASYRSEDLFPLFAQRAMDLGGPTISATCKTSGWKATPDHGSRSPDPRAAEKVTRSSYFPSRRSRETKSDACSSSTACAMCTRDRRH